MVNWSSDLCWGLILSVDNLILNGGSCPPSRQGRASNSLSGSDMALCLVIDGKQLYLRASSISVKSSAVSAFVLIVYVHFPTRP